MSIEPDLFISSGRTDSAAVDQLNNIFLEAAELRVADIHFHESDYGCVVRFRLPGGKLWNYLSTTPEVMRTFDSKIRTRAKLAVSERRASLDGRMSLRVEDRGIDVRVGITPGVGSGQLTVCRLLDQGMANMQLAKIEMTAQVRDAFIRIVEEPNGLLIVTGPTGSGKTTTLYALLNELNNESTNIITIENPVEYKVRGLHQIGVDHHMSFAQALRAVLRQDPDVVMVGEIRDPETANIAVQAAITGHLVLTTLHANSAAGAVTRMIELGVDPMTLAAALRGVSAQRLVRRVRPETPRLPPSDIHVAWLRQHGIQLESGATYPTPAGQHDYCGFTPLMEVMICDHAVQKALPKGIEAITNAAAGQVQYETLGQAGERMAETGLTSMEEILRVVSSSDSVKIKTRRIGHIAVERKYLSRRELRELLDRQQSLQEATGNIQGVGSLMIESGFCTQEQVIDMIGYTAEARDIIEATALSDEDRVSFYALTNRWVAGETSLFEAAVSAGLVTWEKINDAFKPSWRN